VSANRNSSTTTVPVQAYLTDLSCSNIHNSRIIHRVQLEQPVFFSRRLSGRDDFNIASVRAADRDGGETAERGENERKGLHVARLLCMGTYGYVWVCMGMYGYGYVLRPGVEVEAPELRHTSNFSNPAGRVSPLV
jgi:hypothetical protein